jgi:hypothetical protein
MAPLSGAVPNPDGGLDFVGGNVFGAEVPVFALDALGKRERARAALQALANAAEQVSGDQVAEVSR